MMSLHCEKITKDKQGFIDRFGEVPEVCSSCFYVMLTSLAG